MINLYNLGFGNRVLDMASKHNQKKKRDRLDFIKIKNVYVSIDTIRRKRRQLTEKIFAYHIADQDLVSRIYEELL